MGYFISNLRLFHTTVKQSYNRFYLLVKACLLAVQAVKGLNFLWDLAKKYIGILSIPNKYSDRQISFKIALTDKKLKILN